LFVTGPGIKAGQKIPIIDIYDIAPTILNLLGIPHNEDFDGRVIHRIFQEQKDRQYHHSPHLIPNETTYPIIPDDYFEKKHEYGAALH
jgi:arylsulfatase A-like enzyme